MKFKSSSAKQKYYKSRDNRYRGYIKEGFASAMALPFYLSGDLNSGTSAYEISSGLVDLIPDMTRKDYTSTTGSASRVLGSATPLPKILNDLVAAPHGLNMRRYHHRH